MLKDHLDFAELVSSIPEVTEHNVLTFVKSSIGAVVVHLEPPLGRG